MQNHAPRSFSAVARNGGRSASRVLQTVANTFEVRRSLFIAQSSQRYCLTENLTADQRMQCFGFRDVHAATQEFFQLLSQLDHSQQGLVCRQVDQQVKVAAVVFLPLGDGAACRSSCWRAPWPARLKPWPTGRSSGSMRSSGRPSWRPWMPHLRCIRGWRGCCANQRCSNRDPSVAPGARLSDRTAPGRPCRGCFDCSVRRIASAPA